MMTGQKTMSAMALIAVAGAALAAFAASSFVIIGENEQALILRNGAVRAIANPLTVAVQAQPQAKAQGAAPYELLDAGLVWHIPFVDQIERFDRRISTIDISDLPITTSDGEVVKLSGFIRMRFSDIQALHAKAGGASASGEAEAKRRIVIAYTGALRSALGGRSVAEMMAGRSYSAADPAFARVRDVAQRNGITLVDAGVSSIALSQSARDRAIDAMTDRTRSEAEQILAQGAEQASLIKTQAYADVGQIYTQSFGRDPQFYAFYRAMQSYGTIFAGEGQGEGNGKTPVVLPPDAGYLSQMRGQ